MAKEREYLKWLSINSENQNSCVSLINETNQIHGMAKCIAKEISHIIFVSIYLQIS